MKSRYNLVLFLGLIVIIVAGLFLDKTINGFQNQIDRRDTLISQYAAKEDSLRRDNEELIQSLTKLFSGAKVEEDGSFDVQKFINHHNKLIDSIADLKWQLKFLKSQYGLYVDQSQKGNQKIISIKGTEEIDSAKMLLRYYRDRLTKDEEGWNIALRGKDYKDLQKKHNDLIDEFNLFSTKSSKEYGELAKKHNTLVEKYTEQIQFYKNLLQDIADKDLITIEQKNDSTTSYRY